ncbi:cytochrome c oxidase assembly protein [Klenkia terrae]|uniref:cytochrome c oxidase assembly protein n=1 Tax=Klenkia terrae TaxID=1052259 RepID=UPI0036153CFE
MLTPHLDRTSVLPAIALVALVAYLLGVWTLRRRGMRWAWYRTASFVTGIGTVWLVTATQMAGYAMALFSVHMVQKMVLGVLSAALIMLGGPVSLAVRALPAEVGRSSCERCCCGPCAAGRPGSSRTQLSPPPCSSGACTASTSPSSSTCSCARGRATSSCSCSSCPAG